MFKINLEFGVNVSVPGNYFYQNFQNQKSWKKCFIVTHREVVCKWYYHIHIVRSLEELIKIFKRLLISYFEDLCFRKWRRGGVL